MSASLVALLGFAAWALALLLVIGGYRSAAVMGRRRGADSWTRGRAAADPPVIERISHAHLNCLETLPVFAAVVLAAAVAGQGVVTDGLALWFLAARIGQSSSHVISVNPNMILFARFPLFIVQVLILIWWLCRLAGLI